MSSTILAYANAFAVALAAQTGAKLVKGDPEFWLLEESVRVHWLPQGE